LNNYQCYQILGLQEGSSIKEVKAAYRKLALKHHPDKNHSDQDGRKFKLISEAYQTLRVDYKRSIGSGSNRQKYNDKKSNSKYDFESTKHSWGARESDKNSEEDWTKHTGYAEDAYQDFWRHYEKTFWEYYERVRTEATVQTEPIQVEQHVPVSVKVDPERCIACCSCETIAPTVFHVEKNVRVNPKSRVINEEGDKSHKILDAAHTCPTKAISVNEKETQRRLYPY
jgi:DnaJ-class molecular chaperone